MSFGSSLVVFEKAKQSKVCHLGIRKSIYCNSNGDAFEDTPLSYFQFLSLCHPTPSSLFPFLSTTFSLSLSFAVTLSLSPLQGRCSWGNNCRFLHEEPPDFNKHSPHERFEMHPRFPGPPPPHLPPGGPPPFGGMPPPMFLPPGKIHVYYFAGSEL